MNLFHVLHYLSTLRLQTDGGQTATSQIGENKGKDPASVASDIGVDPSAIGIVSGLKRFVF